MKGRVVDNILYKNGRKVVKFWKHDGYGLNVADLHEVNGVVIDSQYDGKLYTSTSNLYEHGISHTFINKSGRAEQQLILPVQYWREVK